MLNRVDGGFNRVSRLRQPRARPRQRASARCHFRHGRRAAALRAFTAAELYLDARAPTLAAAAARCGSNVACVRGAVALIQDKTALDPQSIEKVLDGHLPLLATARAALLRQAAQRVTVEQVTATWRYWTPQQRANFGRSVGVAEIWDFSIAPVIDVERGERAHAVAAE